MTEEDLVAIETLLKQRRHVLFPQEEWSRGMLNGMLNKIPELVAEVRKLSREKEDMAKELGGIVERMRV